LFFDPLNLSIQYRVVDGEQRWKTLFQINGIAVICSRIEYEKTLRKFLQKSFGWNFLVKVASAVTLAVFKRLASILIPLG
jgi:hypothetical protein